MYYFKRVLRCSSNDFKVITKVVISPFYLRPIETLQKLLKGVFLGHVYLVFGLSTAWEVTCFDHYISNIFTLRTIQKNY